MPKIFPLVAIGVSCVVKGTFRLAHLIGGNFDFRRFVLCMLIVNRSQRVSDLSLLSSWNAFKALGLHLLLGINHDTLVIAVTSLCECGW
jgi:hypothetical protein